MYSMVKGFRNTITNTAASSASNFLQQLSGLIIWAKAISSRETYTWTTYCIQVISSYVTSPLSWQVAELGRLQYL